MQGIPVLPNGEPLRRTLVIAGSYSQFATWCRFSKVNPRGRNVRYVSASHHLRGVRGVDLVYTGPGPWQWMSPIWDGIHVLRATGSIVDTYDQYDAYDIVPNIVEGPPDV
jgi:hypothetical protein